MSRKHERAAEELPQPPDVEAVEEAEPEAAGGVTPDERIGFPVEGVPPEESLTSEPILAEEGVVAPPEGGVPETCEIPPSPEEGEAIPVPLPVPEMGGKPKRGILAIALAVLILIVLAAAAGAAYMLLTGGGLPGARPTLTPTASPTPTAFAIVAPTPTMTATFLPPPTIVTSAPTLPYQVTDVFTEEPGTPELREAILAYDSNLREGPGTNYPSITLLPAGTRVLLLARDVPALWVLVRLEDGQEGWIAVTQFIGDIEIEKLPIAENIPTPPPPTPGE